ncbi:MAG: response regulator [Verrucomicrobia bacterium]|nr:response regulator [Verrucomicrobiota bacterium]
METDERGNRSPSNLPDSGVSPKGLILIVDDESQIGEVVEIVLNEKGYHTQLFSDPEVALRFLTEAQERPLLLLTDFLMPEMNGMELIEQCKKIQPDLKTILYSGNVGEEITQYYPARPDRVLDKPFHPNMLVACIEAVLAKR